MGVWRGGVEEWPPSDGTDSSMLAYPFSAMPMRAARASRPGKTLSMMAPPSSMTSSASTPRCFSRSASLRAPSAPPTSSSCPNARMTVRAGRKPSPASMSTASSSPATLTLSSSDPRPHTQSSAMAPSNAPCSQRPSVPGSTGTTSWWAISTIGLRDGSVPCHVYSSDSPNCSFVSALSARGHVRAM